MKSLANVSIKNLYKIQIASVILLVFSACLVWFYTMRLTESVSAENAQHADIQVFMKEKYIDHLLWIQALSEHVYEGKKFEKALDPEKCDFGKWYLAYKPAGDEAEIYKAMDEPHRKLHKTAEAILATDDKAKKAEIFNEQSLVHKTAEAILATDDKAKKAEIFNEQSLVIVKDIKELFNKLADIRKAKAEKNTQRLHAIQSRINISLWLILGATIIGCILMYNLVGKQLLLDPMKSLKESFDKMAKGDLTADFSFNSSNNEIGHMCSTASTTTNQIKKVIQNVSSATSRIAASSEEFSQTSAEVNRSSQEQLSQIEQVASATAEMSQTVIDVAKNASRAADATKQTSGIALKGKEVVERAVSAMLGIADTVKESANTIDDLGHSSQEIGEIVSVINDIADQTNLLALNAAIEAARAGEQGRGFAVVADEVRRLAERTGKATQEITGKISAIQQMAERSVDAMRKGSDEVAGGVELAQKASGSLDEIVGASRNAMDMVQLIATATEEQSAAAEEITHNIENVSSIINRTSAAIGQIDNAAQDLARLSSELQDMIKWFKI
ncbi:MAG: methyl-accepting chemotaxis protein [Nitrospirae bacterium]|nr:methyl-accepting chemotaxis protein [Nitrospirota bacterium]